MNREKLIEELRELLDSFRWQAKEALYRQGGYKELCEWIADILEGNPCLHDKSQNIIIVAWDKNRLIGKDGGLPWKIKGDLPFFKKMTMGNPVVMGKNTWESIVKNMHGPLGGRHNLVVSASVKIGYAGVLKCFDLKQALEEAAALFDPPKDTFIIGGAQIYKAALDADLVDKMYVSEVKGDFEGDTYFPKFDETKWDVSTYAEYEDFTVKQWVKK